MRIELLEESPISGALRPRYTAIFALVLDGKSDKDAHEAIKQHHAVMAEALQIEGADHPRELIHLATFGDGSLTSTQTNVEISRRGAIDDGDESFIL